MRTERNGETGETGKQHTLKPRPYGLHVQPILLLPEEQQEGTYERVIHSERATVEEKNEVTEEHAYEQEEYKKIFGHWCMKQLNIIVSSGMHAKVYVHTRHTMGISADHWNIIVKKGASLELIDKTYGAGNAYRTTTIHIEENSKINYALINTIYGTLATTRTIHVGKNSEANTQELHTRTRAYSKTHIHLKEEGSKGTITSEYKITNNETIELHPTIEHTGKNTHSRINTKGTIEEESTITIQGLIKINNEADESTGFQNSSVLTLSTNAHTNILPNLEIHNNNVQCSHSASVTNIDEEQIYYLRSRGVPIHTARKLILTGYHESGISTFPEKAREEARTILEMKEDE